jgi:hypothetical protein
MKIVKGFIEKSDLDTVQEYIKTIKFHTREDHVPLHDNLFDNDGTKFDIHTRGEMPDNVLDVFSKYSRSYYNLVQSENEDQYHPPMFSKHYIARYRNGAFAEPHNNEKTKPEGTYYSFIVWQNAENGGDFIFPELGKSFKPEPGDLIYFKEKFENNHGITEIISGDLFLSEAWMGKKGQHWMENKASYEEVDWENWEIKGFYE